jgi:hypothetical protein
VDSPLTNDRLIVIISSNPEETRRKLNMFPGLTARPSTYVSQSYFLKVKMTQGHFSLRNELVADNILVDTVKELLSVRATEHRHEIRTRKSMARPSLLGLPFDGTLVSFLP